MEDLISDFGVTRDCLFLFWNCIAMNDYYPPSTLKISCIVFNFLLIFFLLLYELGAMHISGKLIINFNLSRKKKITPNSNKFHAFLKSLTHQSKNVKMDIYSQEQNIRIFLSYLDSFSPCR